MKKENVKILSVLGLIAVFIGIGVLCYNYFTRQDANVKIGAILPLTGSNSFLGEPERNILLFAEEDAKGLNISVRLSIEDSKGSATDGVSAMNKLIAEGVQAVIVSTTGVSRAILPAAEKNGVIIFTQCMDPTITSESKYSFRIFPSYLEEQKLTVNYLANNNYKNVCLLFLNSAGIKPEADAFKSFCQSYGVSVSSEETFESNQTDFRDVLAKIKRKNPDGLLILGYGQNYPPILTQARESGIKCKIFGNVALEQEGATRFGTEIYEGVIFPSFSVAQNNSKIDSLKNRYYQRYGKYPGGFLDYPYFYDAFMILSEVLKKTSGDKEKAIEMLNGGSFQVVGLNLKFNKEGDIYPPLAIGMYSGGKVVQIKE